ncbi:MAG: NUDIX hydrolase [Saprospiraceae bacterium]|nr:NUDIX hydrolase [Saprospiraceae bacterium]
MSADKREWTCVKSEPGPDLKLFTARFDYMLNPRNQVTEKMITLVSPDSVNVIPITPTGEIIFVRQYRFGTRTYTLELPGGIVDPGEEHGVAAKRELQEETGYTSSSWNYLGKIGSNPVFMDSYVHHWVARDVELTHNTALDAGEDVEWVSIPVEEVKQQFLTGKFEHPHAVNALLRFFGPQLQSSIANQGRGR